MKHFTVLFFWQIYNKLLQNIQNFADKSLHLKILIANLVATRIGHLKALEQMIILLLAYLT